MKKNIIYILLFFFSLNTYSLNFKTIIDSSVYETDGIFNYYSGEIKKDEIVKISKAKIYYGVSDWKYSVEIIYKNKEYIMNLENLTPAETQNVLKEEISLYSNNEYNWFPVSGFDLLKSQNRNLLLKIQPKGLKKYQNEKTEFDYEWYDILSNTVPSYFFNSIFSISIFFNKCSFLIKDIKKVENYYQIDSQVYDWFMPDLNINYSKGDSVTLKLSLDGDYLTVHCENQLLGQFARTNHSTKKEIEALLKKNTFDLSKVKWPRHADGTCDYEDVSSIKTVSTPSTNVAKNKTMLVNENLKLRSGEATTSEVLTVMSAGTKVKILELGKSEIIDGISSNWVKVEVQSGAKDRDGRTIRAGTVGWCYGGYLK